jgi:hypothetical protein
MHQTVIPARPGQVGSRIRYPPGPMVTWACSKQVSGALPVVSGGTTHQRSGSMILQDCIEVRCPRAHFLGIVMHRRRAFNP